MIYTPAAMFAWKNRALYDLCDSSADNIDKLIQDMIEKPEIKEKDQINFGKSLYENIHNYIAARNIIKHNCLEVKDIDQKMSDVTYELNALPHIPLFAKVYNV